MVSLLRLRPLLYWVQPRFTAGAQPAVAQCIPNSFVIIVPGPQPAAVSMCRRKRPRMPTGVCVQQIVRPHGWTPGG